MTFVRKNVSAIIALTILALVLTPTLVFGQGLGTGFSVNDTGVGGVMAKLIRLLNFFTVGLMVAAAAFFIYGVVTYIFTADKEVGKTRILHGLIGLFIIVAFWGIIRIVQNTFGVSNQSSGVVGQDVGTGCIVGITC